MPRRSHRKPLLERFLSHIRFDENGHWLWTTKLNSDGYARIKEGGRYSRMIMAHRVAYLLFIGNMPVGTEIDHLCRIRHCVNPDHLEPVLHQENMARSPSFDDRKARITHCPRGHVYAGENLKINPKDGSRHCKACGRIAARECWRRKHPGASRRIVGTEQ